ncbi:MAG: diaminopimelate decarboxylase [Nitrospirae bacterium]|nr:diaminopimelate decarboxylase [Nitrospirota bacterium]
MHSFNYLDGQLYGERVKVEDIAREVGTPFYLYSCETLTNHYRNFEKALAGLEHLICYAYKANSNLALCKILAKEGCGADVVSGGELRKALQAGVPPEKIVFNGNGKTVEEMELALQSNILMFNVDSRPELLLLDEVAGRSGKKARIALRVNPDIDPQTHPHIATGLKESKFGFEFSQVIEGYKLAQTLRNIEVAGIQMHIGSQITKVDPFVEALKKIVDLAGELKKLDIKIKYVNVGGGLGITYSDEEPPSFADYAQSVIPAIKEIGAKGIFEPGRVLVGNAGILVTKVLYVKETQSKKFVVVDAGMGDLFRPAFYSAYHEIKPVNLKAESQNLKADIVGPICESGDFLAKDREIPAVKRGEFLAVFSAGAYGFSMASNYNSRLRPAEVLVKEDKFRIVRKRETYEDLGRGEDEQD